MNNGIIVKALSGFYYVKADDNVYECKAKGKFKFNGQSPLVGDKVTFSDDRIITAIEPRKNSFIRPAVANIDCMVFIASNTKPITDPFLIDRVSVIANSNDCELVVCINKTDIDQGEELFHIYSAAGFKTISTSAVTNEGIDELKQYLHGKISAFTGNSGVGKSSILNSIIPGANILTDDISEKLGRGKHTTRHVEFYMMDENSYIADTPGFASFDIEMMNDITEEELPSLFYDFEPYLGNCKFLDCHHINEPSCGIKRAVEQTFIASTRYDSYVKLFDIVHNNKSWD